MSAYELFESRRKISSLSGRQTMASQWLVQLAEDADPELIDPLDDSQLPPFGSGHAFVWGAICKSKSVNRRIAPRAWIIDVLYEIPDTLVPTFGSAWQISVTGSLETERVIVERVTAEDLANGVRPRVIGPNKYEPIDTVGDYSYFAFDEQHGTAVRKYLKRLEGRERMPLDLTKPTGAMTLTREYHYPPWTAGLFDRLNMVNKDRFYNAPPMTLKFANFTMSSKIGVAGISVDGLAYDLSLCFLWNRDGWQPEFIHTWKADNGSEGPIFIGNTDTPVTEMFSGFLLTSFNAMLSRI